MALPPQLLHLHLLVAVPDLHLQALVVVKQLMLKVHNCLDTTVKPTDSIKSYSI
jgi:hypothetical protein